MHLNLPDGLSMLGNTNAIQMAGLDKQIQINLPVAQTIDSNQHHNQ